ncbi:MAG: hypothetical protein WDW38_004480 [Sanguina aurantia]
MAPFNEDGRFMGRWNIVRSTLGMWDPKGGKQSPCLIYESFDGKGWAEHVEYQTAGVLSSTLQTRRIFGRDTIHGTGNPRGFKWRGAGLLSPGYQSDEDVPEVNHMLPDTWLDTRDDTTVKLFHNRSPAVIPTTTTTPYSPTPPPLAAHQGPVQMCLSCGGCT